MLNYEKPGNTQESNKQKRISMLKKIYNEMVSILDRGQVYTEQKKNIQNNLINLLMKEELIQL